jgi:hypothetical protein
MLISNMKRSDLPADLPAVLRPRLLLFLSADIVGSTAIKQANAFDADSGQDAIKWLIMIESFYAEMVKSFSGQWTDNRHNFSSSFLKKWRGDAPNFWKTVGDEIIFTIEISDTRHIHFIFDAWIKTISHMRRQFSKFDDELRANNERELDVKSSAWIAGFPRRNKQIITVDGMTDFIGSGIDIGFRIGQFATTQKMMISLDVAYLITLAPSPEERQICQQKLYFDGRFSLKGVFKNKPYPLFWIDISREDTLDFDEMRFQGDVNNQQVRDIFTRYYKEEFKDFTHKPFVIDDPSRILDEVPDDYLSWLNAANSEYHAQQASRQRAEEDATSFSPDHFN